jgi:ATP-dependent exoDNAse (exonuclease V) beta subunit
MDFKPDFVDDDYYDGLICDVKFLRDPCGAKDMNYYERMNPGKKFEYAHALTTHVVQGSSLDTIMFVDSFMKDAEYHMRLRYTAITRARHKVYYILPKSKYDGWTDLKFGGFRPDNY